MNRFEIEKIYYDWEKALEQEYTELFPDAKYTVFDGTVSPFDYFLSPIKVMILNREPYDEDCTSYNIANALKKEIEEGKQNFRGTYWINQNIKERLALCSLLNRIADLQESEAIDYAMNLDEDTYRTLLYKSAYCNIKKSDGVNGSSKNNLLKYAQRGWSILEKQISFLNPTLIIGGNIIEGIIENVKDLTWGNELYDSTNTKGTIYQIQFGDKYYPIIDLYHPSYMVHSQDLFYALKNSAQKHPGFWENRIGQKCFNL